MIPSTSADDNVSCPMDRTDVEAGREGIRTCQKFPLIIFIANYLQDPLYNNNSVFMWETPRPPGQGQMYGPRRWCLLLAFAQLHSICGEIPTSLFEEEQWKRHPHHLLKGHVEPTTDRGTGIDHGPDGRQPEVRSELFSQLIRNIFPH